MLGKVAAIRGMPSPQPSPTGEGADYSKFCGCRRFEKQLGFTTVDAGRLKNKKQPAQPVFLAKPLTPTAARPLSRGRELERGQQAARLVLGRLGCWERLLQFWEMPSPQPSPTGEGAGCSRFWRCRSSEKECPNINSRNFSGSLYRKADRANATSVFQTAFEPISGACAARHERDGLGLQGKWRTRACVPYTSYVCFIYFKFERELI